MELGLGFLRLAPDDFWNMTLRELVAALDGYAESKGGKRKTDPAELVDELRELMGSEAMAPSKSIKGKPGNRRL